MTITYLPVAECVPGIVYELHSRNLLQGVWTGTGFIGVREKFGSRFLDTEYHYDEGGTAFPLKSIVRLPESIPLRERDPSYDQITRRPTAFDRPIVDGGKGWYFTDTGEASEEIRSVSPQNEKLYEFLEELLKSA